MRVRSSLVSIALVALTLSSAAPAHAEEPLDCTNALSTQDMNTCAGLDFAKADAALNATYEKAIGSIPEMASDETQFNAKSWEEALRTSQRAWIAFRDAECEEHVAMFWTGGSGATVDIIGCKTEKTEARTKELKERYEPE